MHESRPASQSPAQNQLDAAQSESEHAYDRARQAQRDATEKSQQAADAEQDALKKQAEAQQAQQRAQTLRREAEQAQREAMREGQQAAAEAQRAQQRALTVQPRAQAQAQAMGAAAATEGTVRSVKRDEIVISRDNAPDLRLVIDPQRTAITQDGQNAQLAEVKPGSSVVVTYRIERDQPVADAIDLRPQAAQRDSEQP